MGTKHFRTLGDFSMHRCYVRVTCQACGRSVLFNAGDLIGFFGGNYGIRRLEARMTCKGVAGDRNGCGARNARIRPDQIGPPTKVMPEPIL